MFHALHTLYYKLDRCSMDESRTPSAPIGKNRTKTGRPKMLNQCLSLRQSNRLPMAQPAARLSLIFPHKMMSMRLVFITHTGYWGCLVDVNEVKMRLLFQYRKPTIVDGSFVEVSQQRNRVRRQFAGLSADGMELSLTAGSSFCVCRWFCGFAEALDCGADICVVVQVSSAQQRLWTQSRFKHSNDTHLHN